MEKIRTVGVAGAGTMGTGIAIVAARAGNETIIYDLEESNLERAREQISGFLNKSVQKGKIAEHQYVEILSRFRFAADINEISGVDIVIEAVYENLDAKQKLFGTLNEICNDNTIFASNTSTLSISEIASGSGRDDRVVGMHFCLPAQVMKLVEMSAGLNTSDETYRRAWEFCVSLGQIPTQTKDTPGFILNYFLVPFNNDVIRLIEKGVAEPNAVDNAVKVALGYPMGPCELLDLIGLDTQKRLCDAFYPVTNDPRTACPPLLRRMVAAGRLGRKSGRGFHDYERDAMFGG
jgi:3-hydroxybutyryl-CoA dehydrogenase